MQKQILFIIICLVAFSTSILAQPPKGVHWTKDGNGYYEVKAGNIVLTSLPAQTTKSVIEKSKLIPAGSSTPLTIRNFFFSDDATKVLIYTNSKRVWRYDTRGDYWILNLSDNKLVQIGKSLPPSSLMFAKFSPDGSKVAYVSGHNIYVENADGSVMKKITSDGTERLINGTFDWAYEEEFGCRDGFRWSPDGKSIAYWQIDATTIKNFLLIDNTDSIYSFTKPVEYPKVGESPSSCKIGVVNLESTNTVWMNVPGDPRQHYIPRMEWSPNTNELIIEQLNRKQNEAKVMLCNAKTGDVKQIYDETDKAWIDIKERWNDGDPTGWEWLNNGTTYLWVSEKDGWRHIFLENKNGNKEVLLTKGDYDIITIKAIDDKSGFVYFMASPNNATQQYLYRVKLDGSSISPELISPSSEKGTHDYDISSNFKYAKHSFSNINTEDVSEWVNLPQHAPLNGKELVLNKSDLNTEFFKVTTEDDITMDGWVVKPANFDSAKKYPIVFFVYTEPAGQTVTDSWGASYNFLYPSINEDGYIYISLDGRGTPAPKGAAWRKAIYRNIGRINIRDQAMAAKQILKWNYVDTSRVAVWGWSGGASTTLNLLFQYPDIYKTGIAVAAVTNQLTYDNIYQERYMGLPQENMDDFIKGSPITYAKNLEGHLLYVHGTGDDNVHYQNAELLINELVKYNKQFQLMSYPNRSHGMSEGEGTFRHLSTLYQNFLHQYCPISK